MPVGGEATKHAEMAERGLFMMVGCTREICAGVVVASNMA